MFLGKQALEIAEKKQACLLRTEINRAALKLMIKKEHRPGGKALALGMMTADLIYSIWRSKNESGD